MNNLVLYNELVPPESIVYNDEKKFHAECVERIRTATFEELMTWITRDAAFCYLISWLDPSTRTYEFPIGIRKSSVSLIGKCHDWNHLLGKIRLNWKGKPKFNQTILNGLAWFIGETSHMLFKEYSRRFHRYSYSYQLLLHGLPFYHNRLQYNTTHKHHRF